MRRAPYVMVATVAGLAGVLTYHTNGTSLAALGTSPASQPSSGSKSGSAGTGSAASSPASTAPPSKSTTSSGPRSKTTKPATTVPPAPATNGTATGAVEQYGYGQLSVRVTIASGHITAINTSQLQTAESYSQQIAVQAIPMLRSEILKAQSTRVYGITGATYTSEAYATSVQSALDKLHFK